MLQRFDSGTFDIVIVNEVEAWVALTAMRTCVAETLVSIKSISNLFLKEEWHFHIRNVLLGWLELFFDKFSRPGNILTHYQHKIFKHFSSSAGYMEKILSKITEAMLFSNDNGPFLDTRQVPFECDMLVLRIFKTNFRRV